MTDPVVVGALGGSGTRLVASMLIDLGYHLGDDLNPERDNLWFTLLFKRPRWYARVIESRPEEIQVGLAAFERAMTRGGEADPGVHAFVLRALGEALTGRHGQTRAHTKGWPVKQAWALLHPPERQQPALWGFKEPNSHLYLRPLAQRYPGLKFVYVMRHGLDMAYSGNRQQLHNWGPLFGVRAGDGGMSVPRAMLEYWIRASERAIEDGRRLLGDRFLVLNYDALCREPEANLPPLLRFLGLDPARADLGRLAALAERPATMERFKQHDLSEFDAPSLEKVRAFGFSLDQ